MLYLAAFLVALTILVAESGAETRQLLVVTRTLNALRRASAIYVQQVDMDNGRALPGAERARGTGLLTPVLVQAHQRRAFLGTTRERPAWVSVTQGPEAFVSRFETSPFRLVHQNGTTWDRRWQAWPAAVQQGAQTSPLMWLGRRETDRGTEYYAWLQRGDQTFSFGPPSDAWKLSAAPAGAALTEYNQALYAALLLHGGSDESPALLLFRDGVAQCVARLDSSAPVEMESAQASPRIGLEPGGLTFSRTGRYVFALFSGYDLEQPTGRSATWAGALDLESGESVGPMIRLTGRVELPRDSVCAGIEEECWVATREPERAFGRVYSLAAGPGGLDTRQDTPLANVYGPVTVAVSGETGDVALGIDRRVEIWPAGQVAQARVLDLGNLVGALAWSQGVLYAGVANQVLQIDAGRGVVRDAVELDTGHVAALAPLVDKAIRPDDQDYDGIPDTLERALGLDPTNPDTDADGMHDGMDPMPRAPSPRLVAPWEIVFREEAVGREVHTILIAPEHGDGWRWSLRHAPSAAPWLVAYPAEGTAPGVLYLGIDSSKYPRDLGEVVHPIRLVLEDPVSSQNAYGSPADLTVRVVPRAAVVRRILWLWPREEDAPFRSVTDPWGMRAAGDLLSQAPDRFAHAESAGPYTGPLAENTVVVVDTGAAARGAITRSALLDYVADGGGALVVGQPLDSSGPSLPADWLAPTGIRMNCQETIESVACEAVGSAALWTDEPLLFDKGCLVGVGSPGESAAQSAGGRVGLALTFYGQGRLAVLAGDTPLREEALRTAESRRFVRELFRWLAGAGAEVADLNSDGLPDTVDDTRAKAMRTHYLMDDKNDARLADRTDPMRLPAPGAPVITSVVPPARPAEGGGRVRIAGQRFSPLSEVRFGDRRALETRFLGTSELEAVVPPYAVPEGGVVDVSVTNPPSRATGTLAGGFTYTPISNARLVLRAFPVAANEGGGNTGTVGLYFEAPPQAVVGHVFVALHARPGKQFEWGAPVVAPGIRNRGIRMMSQRVAPDILHITLIRDDFEPFGLRGQLLTAPWSAGPGSVQSYEVSIREALVAPRGGQVLPVDIEGAALIPMRGPAQMP